MAPVPYTHPRGGAATIADVAARAGVGVSTVSRVLNESPLVADRTRARVLVAIEELNYHPSRLARNLSLQRTHTIAALVPVFNHPSTLERLGGVVARLADSGYDIALFALERPHRRDESFRLLSHPGRADGVLLVSLSPTDTEVERLREARVPVVVVDGEHAELPSVVIDDLQGGELATRYLIDLGHRKIAFVGDPPVSPYHLTAGYGRREGYLRALRAARLPITPEYLKEGPHDRHVAHRLTDDLLALAERPTAIFAGSDTQALGVLEAAELAGLAVPGDLSVVGFDDIGVSAYVGLTTVRQPLRASGEHGAELLLDALESGELTPICETLPLELVARKTAAPPRRSE